MRAFQPKWSADAKRIAFMATAPGKRWQIYVVSAAGGNPQQMTMDERNHGDPDWSPDGNSLTFGGLPFLESDNGSAIYILDLRTRKVSAVTGSDGLCSPAWSPDGRYLLAQSNDYGKFVILNLATRKWSDLAKIPTGYQAWSRDGKYVYFDSVAEGELGYYRVRISDRKLERLTSLKELGRLASGTFGAWTGLAPDDSPLALRDIGSQEIYALDWEAP